MTKAEAKKRAMTKAEAKKRLLGFCVLMLTGDDVCFGDIDAKSQEYKALDAAREELVEEFNRRSAL